MTNRKRSDAEAPPDHDGQSTEQPLAFLTMLLSMHADEEYVRQAPVSGARGTPFEESQ